MFGMEKWTIEHYGHEAYLRLGQRYSYVRVMWKPGGYDATLVRDGIEVKHHVFDDIVVAIINAENWLAA